MEEDRDGEVDEDSLVPISALQHMLYCPRQCALIHVERKWSENVHTAEGRALHERVDAGSKECRPSARTERSVTLRSLRLGVAGIADVVEDREGCLLPVEYKRGRPKTHQADEVQLCAQAVCLEEMRQTTIKEGALFYGKTKRRKTVEFDETLRALTVRTAARTRTLIEGGEIPAAQYEPKKCDACSMKETCQPKVQPGKGEIGRRIARAIES